MEDRLLMLGPGIDRQDPTIPDAFPRYNRAGWDAFFEVAPADFAEAIAAIHADPAPLAAALRSSGATLIHGDLRPPNVGLGEHAVQLLDWGLCAAGPPELDYAWWLYASDVDLPVDAIEAEIFSVAGDLIDERRWQLALLTDAVIQGGAYWGSSISHPLDGNEASDAREHMDWFVDRCRAALDDLSS
jgi:hypothetical protein